MTLRRLGLDRLPRQHESSDKRLEELGYTPEFKREMSLFGVLGMSFCAIGILTGMSSAFQTGLFAGGPLGLFWGWNVRVCIFFVSILVAYLQTLILTTSDLQLLHAPDCVVFGGDLQCLVSRFL
jgi:hypothetical protein